MSLRDQGCPQGANGDPGCPQGASGDQGCPQGASSSSWYTLMVCRW